MDNFDEEFTKEGILLFYLSKNFFYFISLEPVNSFVTTTKMNVVNQHQTDFSDFSYMPKNILQEEEEF